MGNWESAFEGKRVRSEMAETDELTPPSGTLTGSQEDDKQPWELFLAEQVDELRATTLEAGAMMQTVSEEMDRSVRGLEVKKKDVEDYLEELNATKECFRARLRQVSSVLSVTSSSSSSSCK